MATKTNRAAMYARIEAHGRALLALFPLANPRDPVELCKAVRRLEKRASRATVGYCNGDISTEMMDKAGAAYLGAMDAILRGSDTGVPVILNRDPRGYAFKVDDEWMRANADRAGSLHRDWGGYGIIAPDLTDSD